MSNKDDSTIDLSGLGEEMIQEIGGDEEEFKIGHLEAEGIKPFVRSGVDFDETEFIDKLEPANLRVEKEAFVPGPTDKVKVKFDKFITLVATHTYEDILKKNADEDVIISTNLLTDLANAHSDDGGGIAKKIPLIFVGGLVIGLIVAWLMMKG